MTSKVEQNLELMIAFLYDSIESEMEGETRRAARESLAEVAKLARIAARTRAMLVRD